MIFQEDALLNPLAKWGCYFTSIVNMVEKERGQTRSAAEVFRTFGICLRSGFVDQESTVLQPDEILGLLGSLLKLKSKSDLPGALTPTLPGEYEILKFAKPGHEHFVLGDGKGKVAFDPLPNHDMKPYGLVGKRIFSIGGK